MRDDFGYSDDELIARDGPDALTSERRSRMDQFRRSTDLKTEIETLTSMWEEDKVGVVLGEFLHGRRWSHWQLADWLGLSVFDFKRLSQEARPSGDPEEVRLILALLAKRYEADAERLCEAFGVGKT